MIAFLTVGSTQFDALVQEALSRRVLEALKTKGYTRLVVQSGNSCLPDGWLIGSTSLEGLLVEIWQFKPTLQDVFDQADLVISHAGSGTILDVLRMAKPLIVVPNESLLDNHQKELAAALAGLSHLKESTVEELSTAIDTLNSSGVVPFPDFDGSKFSRLLDDEMGFA